MSLNEPYYENENMLHQSSGPIQSKPSGSGLPPIGKPFPGILEKNPLDFTMHGSHVPPLKDPGAPFPSYPPSGSANYGQPHPTVWLKPKKPPFFKGKFGKDLTAWLSAL